jgi:hypothetical protein
MSLYWCLGFYAERKRKAALRISNQNLRAHNVTPLFTLENDDE